MPHNDDDGPGDAAAIMVRVVRTGGFAGLKREWTAEPGSGEESVWIALIEDCPWDAAAAGTGVDGADRFVWIIEVRVRRAEMSARLGDGDMTGPWRALVDAVREFSAPARGRRDTAGRGR